MKHKVWESEEEILAAIDRALDRLRAGRERCVLLEKEIRKYRRKIDRANEAGRSMLWLSIDECLKESEKLSKRMRSIEDTTLPRLKRTLAAFRTRTFDFMGDYQGVVAA